ncbi:MAG TPA: integrase [Devosiaceae bacterium]|jgi:hypothetical protein
MPDEFRVRQSEALILLYAKYRIELDSTAIGGKWMPYRWWQLPNPLSARWMAYAEMLQEFSSELANIINDLTHNVHRLRAWGKTVSPLSNDEKLAATHEFINNLGTVALGQPYAIKSRFAYAAAHLCHQANRTKEPGTWKDEFPQKETLYLNEIEPFCRGWGTYRSFKLKVEPIAGKTFKESSDDFRNAYNHRFSSRFVLGVTSIASRFKNEEGGIGYAFGGNPPLALADIADLLEKERDLCYLAFEAFQELVGEQTVAIGQFEGSEQSSER